MGKDRNEKQRSEEIIMEKDAKIEDLKTVQRAYLIRIKELEDEVASLQNSRMPTDSKKTEPSMPIFKLPELPQSLREKRQPTSVLANLPALPVFTGFDTPEEGTALETTLSTPEVSPEGFPPRPSALFSGTKSTLGSTMPPNLPTPLEGRRKGAVAPLLPDRQSSRVVLGSPPPATGSTLSRDPRARSSSLRDSSKSASFTLSAIQDIFQHHAHFLRAILYLLEHRLCLHIS